MEATPEQSAEGLAIVRVLSAVLDRLVSANAPLALADPGQVTKFHAMKAPAIGIQTYLERIHKYASCSNECFILALIYIDRLIQRNNFLLTELNVHRVVITAILLAAKFFDDAYYNNCYYAKVGGVLVAEMNGLEVDFLFRINFSLHVTPDVFEKYRTQLLSQANVAGIFFNASPLLAPPPSYHAPVLPNHHALPDVQFSDQPVLHDATVQITPSPSHHAGRIGGNFVAMQQQHHAIPMNDLAFEYFPNMQRSFSEPVNINISPSSWQCSQKQAVSAPPMPAALAMRYSRFEDQLMALERQLFPIQSGVVHHHHHGNFTQHGVVDGMDYLSTIEAQNLVSTRLLAGLSGTAL